MKRRFLAAHSCANCPHLACFGKCSFGKRSLHHRLQVRTTMELSACFISEGVALTALATVPLGNAPCITVCRSALPWNFQFALFVGALFHSIKLAGTRLPQTQPLAVIYTHGPRRHKHLFTDTWLPQTQALI